MAVNVTRDTYEAEVIQHQGAVLVDFWGPQCRPCLALMPAIEKMAEEYAGRVKIAKVNAAENRMLCAKLRVLGLPAFVFYKNGVEVKRLSGDIVGEKEIREAVGQLIS